MSETVVIAWFGLLFGIAIVYVGLIWWTFRRLRVRHDTTYESIGSPSLFWNNSARINWLFIKFLFQGQWQGLDDSQLSTVARVMQVLLIVYMAGFAAFVAAFMAIGVT